MFLRTALRIAWREFRATPAKFWFVVLAVAIGIAALTGVQGFAASVRAMLVTNSRELVAADVQGQIWDFPTAEQLAKVEALGRDNGALTRVTETVSMAGSTTQRTPLMVSVKAVDPARYPFYGHLALTSKRPLEDVLNDDESAVVAPELLLRMHMKVGDCLRLGGQPFTVKDTIQYEPDRLASGFGPGARILITRQGLDRAGLIQFGSRAAQRFLFKLKPRTNLDAFKKQLAAIFPHVFISDYREGSPMVGKAISLTATFLSLIGTITLIVGSVGASMAMYSHIQQRMETIAIMKAVGGRAVQILQIYVTQTVVLGTAGAVIGVLVGALVQRFFLVLLRPIFVQLPPVPIEWSFALQGICIGLCSTLLFTLPALLRVRSLKPNLVFRRDVAQNGTPRRERVLQAGVAGLILAGVAGIAIWLSGSLQIGMYFFAALIVSLGVLTGAAWVLTFLLKRTAYVARETIPVYVRHGIGNLYRPGSQTKPILVALGIGVLFISTTFLLQRIVLQQINGEGPDENGNVFLIDVRNASAVKSLVEKQPGVTGKVELSGYVVTRFLTRDGQPMAEAKISKELKDRLGAVRITTAAEQPKTLQVESGKWWTADETNPQLAVSEEAKRDYGLKMGDQLGFVIAGRTVEARIVAIFTRKGRSSVRYDLVAPAESMTKFPVVYFGAVHVEPAHIPDVETALFDKFPTITVVNVADILGRIRQAVNQVTSVIRFLSAFAIGAGLIILAGNVSATRQRRIRESAVFKTLGATRSRVRAISYVEFSTLGLIAGAIGGGLGNALTILLADRFLETRAHWDWPLLLIAMASTVLVANVSAWLASFGILRQRPLQILRGE